MAEAETEREQRSVEQLIEEVRAYIRLTQGCGRGSPPEARRALEALERRRDRLVEALEEIVSTGAEPICISCDRRVEIARDVLEAVEGDGEGRHVLDDYDAAVSLVQSRLRSRGSEGVEGREMAEDIVDHLRAEQEHRETEPEGY